MAELIGVAACAAVAAVFAWIWRDGRRTGVIEPGMFPISRADQPRLFRFASAAMATMALSTAITGLCVAAGLLPLR